jgi:hypothetical protein
MWLAITVMPVVESVVKTAPQLFHGWTATVFLSRESLISLRFSKDTVIPPSIVAAPRNALCPPDLKAKGHCVRRERRSRTGTADGEEGLKIQYGRASAESSDQNADVKAE